MATQKQRVNQSFNTGENDFRGLQEEDKKIKTRNFRILMGSIITALVIGGTTAMVLKDPAEWEPWVKTLTSAQAKKPEMTAKITEQKVKLEGLYSVNKTGIVSLQKYKDVATVLKKAPEQIVAFYDQNERLYKTSVKDLTSDQKILDGLFTIPGLEVSAKTDDKVKNDLKTAKKTYLSKEAMQLMTSYQTTPPNRIAGMEQLSKNITDKTKDLEAAYNTIVADVATKLKAGKFDLNAGEKVFMEAAGQEINSTKSQIENAKKDLDESEYADLLKTNEAAYSQVASSVAADKKKVEDLVKQYGASNVQVQPNSGTGQTVVVHENRGMGFMDYWLISQWMNTSSGASNYNSGYAAGSAAASSNNRMGAGIASSGYNTPTKVAPTTASIAASQNAQKGYSNLYSVNNPDSPVAKRLAAAEAARNPAAARSSGGSTISQKIAEKRNTAIVRKAEAAKASARAAEARSAAARSNSSSSSSGFGKSGGGMSGGG